MHLVRTVDWRVTLREYCFPFVRTVDVFRTQYDLPACRYPAGRMEDIIIVVSLIHFRTFASLMCFVTVEDNTRRSDRCICFRIQFADSDYTFQSGTTSCVCVYHIYFSVFIQNGQVSMIPFPAFTKTGSLHGPFGSLAFTIKAP